jgi:O-antigen/teichoic acid export membrane protein
MRVHLAFSTHYMRSRWDENLMNARSHLLGANVVGRLFRGSAWSSLSSVGAACCSLFGGLVCARLMGNADYGALGMALSTNALFGSLIGTGLATTTIKNVAESRKQNRQRAGRVLDLMHKCSWLFGGILAIGLWFFAPAIATKMLDAPKMVTPLRACALLCIVQTISEWQIGALVALERFRRMAWISFVRAGLLFFGMVAGAWIGGISGAMLGTGIGVLVSCAFGHLALRRSMGEHGLSFERGGFGREKGILLTYLLPTVAAGIVFQPLVWLAHTLIVRQPSGFAEMAIVSVANQWRAALTVVPISLQKVIMPILASSYAEGQESGTHSFEISHWFTQICVWAISVPLLLLAPWILALYGKGFEIGLPIFAYVLGGTAVGFLGNACSSLVLARGWVWLSVLGNFICGAILWVITFLGVSHIGAKAFGLGVLSAYFGLYMLTFTILWRWKIVTGGLYLRSALAAMLLSAVVFVAAQVSPQVGVWLTLPVTAFGLWLLITFYRPTKSKNSKPQ